MPMIPEIVASEIIQRSNIVEVINSFVPLKKSGNGSWKACCPFHQEKTPSFHVSETKQLYYCFGCQKGGDVVKFVREYLNLDYVEAMQHLAQRCGVVIPQDVSPEEEAAYRRKRSEAGRLYDLHKLLADFYRQELLRNPASAVAQYFATRQIPNDVAQQFMIGAAPDSWDASINFLKSKGFSEQEIVAAGVAISKENGRCYDRFRNRLVFSITDENNRVIGFSARIIVKDDNAPKYVNSPETPIFHKGSILYGLAQARDSIRRNKFAIVCEGQLDTIALHRAGLDMAVAPQGLAFRQEQAELLKRYTDKLYLCFDSDAAGQQGTLRVLEFLLPINFEIYAVNIAGGKDPDEIMRTQSAEVLHEALKNAIPLTTIIMNGLQRSFDLNTPAGKVAAAESAVKLLGLISNPLLREVYLEEIANRLRISAKSIFDLHRKQKRFASSFQQSAPAQAQEPQQVPEKNYNDMRPENIRHAEASLLMVALSSADGPRRISEVLDESLLSDAPAAEVLKELLNMSLNGEWYSGADLLNHLPEKLTKEQNVVKLLINDSDLTEAQIKQILEDCPLELQKERNKQRSNELLYELRETADVVRQMQILEELKKLRG